MDQETTAKFKKLEDDVASLRMFAESLQRENADLTKQISDLSSKQNLVQLPKEEYNRLRVLRLDAALPVYDTTTNLKGIHGQPVVVNASANAVPRKILAVQINNTISSVALT